MMYTYRANVMHEHFLCKCLFLILFRTNIQKQRDVLSDVNKNCSLLLYVFFSAIIVEWPFTVLKEMQSN